MITPSDRHITADAHIRDPRPGDLYHEMYSTWLVVVEVEPEYVWVLAHPDRDNEQRLCLPRQRFIDYMRYGHGESKIGWGPDGMVIGPWSFHKNLGPMPSESRQTRLACPEPTETEPHLVRGTE